MRKGPTCSMILASTGSDFLRWLMARRMGSALHLDHDAADGEQREDDQEENIRAVRAVLQDVIRLAPGEHEHDDHENEIPSFVHLKLRPEITIHNTCAPHGLRPAKDSKPIFKLQTGDTSEVYDVVGDKNGVFTECMSGDHHVIAARDEATSFQVGTNVAVRVRCMSIP